MKAAIWQKDGCGLPATVENRSQVLLEIYVSVK